MHTKPLPNNAAAITIIKNEAWNLSENSEYSTIGCVVLLLTAIPLDLDGAISEMFFLELRTSFSNLAGQSFFLAIWSERTREVMTTPSFSSLPLSTFAVNSSLVMSSQLNIFTMIETAHTLSLVAFPKAHLRVPESHSATSRSDQKQYLWKLYTPLSNSTGNPFRERRLFHKR